jgi:membrane protease YdiL (CAAX protease family)
LSLVYIRTRSILAPITMHALFNATNIGLALLATAASQAPPAVPV